jgi:hypothetical protein
VNRHVSLTNLTIAILATWRLTHFLWGEDGPWNASARLRRIAGEGFWGALLDCFYCLSLWVAVPVAWSMSSQWLEAAMVWLAISGGAILLERVTTPARVVPRPRWRVDPPAPHVEEDASDVVLR